MGNLVALAVNGDLEIRHTDSSAIAAMMLPGFSSVIVRTGALACQIVLCVSPANLSIRASSVTSQIEYPAPQGDHHGGSPITYLELLKNRVDVEFNRPLGDGELLADLAVGQSKRGQT